MSRSKSTRAGSCAIHETRGFEALSLSVQEWLRTLTPVECAGVVAWKHEKGDLLSHLLNDWTPPQIDFALSVLAPNPDRLIEELEDAFGSDDEDFDDTVAPDVWRQIVRRQRRWKPARVLFGWSVAIDGQCFSSVHTWEAFALTQGLAVLTYHDDDEGIHTFPTVLGVIQRPRPVLSAAVLIQGDDPNLFRTRICDELSAWGIADEELYRLFLARTGRKLDEVLSLTRGELRKFAAWWAPRGFKRISALLHQFEEPVGESQESLLEVR